jgi:ribose transport system permease protein
MTITPLRQGKNRKGYYMNKAEVNESRIRRVLKNEMMPLLIALAVLCVIVGALTPKFFTRTNMMNLLKQSSIMGIAGLGVVCQLLLGEIDLSLGYMQAACGCFMVYMLNNVVHSFFIALLLTLLLGAAVGYINAFIFTKSHMTSFISTLGTSTIVKGVTFVLTKSAAIENHVSGFDYLGTGTILGVPVAILIFLILAVLMGFMLQKTTLGRKIYAVGGNPNAASLSGLNVDRIKIGVFMLAGVLIALTAVITASRMDSGQPTTGTGFELIVISSVILGGVSASGGRGNMIGGLVGILLLQVLNNGLILLNVSSFYQEIARGVVIIIAVSLDERKKRDIGKKMLKGN